MGLLIGVIFLPFAKGPTKLAAKAPFLQLAGGALAVISVTLFVSAVKFVPLADPVAVAFVAPFIATIPGALLLGENVGRHRLSAVIAGFIGTLVVTRPGPGAFHPAVIPVSLAAAAFALRQILSRMLAAATGSQQRLPILPRSVRPF